MDYSDDVLPGFKGRTDQPAFYGNAQDLEHSQPIGNVLHFQAAGTSYETAPVSLCILSLGQYLLTPSQKILQGGI